MVPCKAGICPLLAHHSYEQARIPGAIQSTAELCFLGVRNQGPPSSQGSERGSGRDLREMPQEPAAASPSTTTFYEALDNL